MGAESPILGLRQALVPAMALSRGLGHRHHGMNHQHNLLVTPGLGFIKKQAQWEAPRSLSLLSETTGFYGTSSMEGTQNFASM